MDLQNPPPHPWAPAFSDAFLDDASDLFADNNLLVVVGPIGSNRGSLASRLAGSPDAAVWWRTEDFRYRAAAPYDALNRLFPTVDARAGDEPEDVVAALGLVLKRRIGRPTLVVREADLCDAESVAVLSLLVAGDAIRLIATIDPESADDHPLARDAARIDLNPLTDQVVAHLLEARFGARPHPTVVSMLAQRSQGAYAVLRELADAGWAAGQLVVKSGALVADTSVPISHVDFIAEADHTTVVHFAPDHPAADLLTVAALLVELEVAEAERVFGRPALDAALAGGVLRRVGSIVSYRSHAEAVLIQRSTTVDERRELFDVYGRKLRRASRRDVSTLHLASWLMSIDEPVDPVLATRAAGRANRQGLYAQAIRIATTVPGALRPSRLVIELLHAYNESGDVEATRDLLAATDPARLDDDDLFPYLRWTSSAHDSERAAAVAARIAADSHDDPHRLAVLEVIRLYGQVFQDCSDDLRRRIMSLAMGGQLSSEMHAVALIAAAGHARHTGRSAQGVDLATKAVDMLRDDPAVGASTLELALEALALCHLSDADFTGAEKVLTEYSTPGAAFGNFGRLGNALWGLLEFFRGDLGSALANARVAVAAMPASDPHHMRGWVEAMLAQILINAGETDEARGLLEQAESHPAGPRRVHHLERMLATACAWDVLGEPERALAILAGITDAAREHGLTLLEIDSAVLTTQIGGPIYQDVLFRAVADHDDLTGTCRIWERFAEACEHDDVRALVDLANELRKAGASMFAAEVAQFAIDLPGPDDQMTAAESRLMQSLASPMSHRQLRA